MTSRLFIMTAAAVIAAQAAAYAQTAEWNQGLPAQNELKTILAMGKDNRYKMTERKAEAALDILQGVVKYADDVKSRSEKLRDGMLENHYDDLVNSSVRYIVNEAQDLYKAIKNRHSDESKRVKIDLKSAEKGNYEPIEQTIERIMTRVNPSDEARVKQVEAKLVAARGEYGNQVALAARGLASFVKSSPVAELLASQPPLVKAVTTYGPRTIILEKIDPKYNDPRFGKITSPFIHVEGGNSVEFAVVIK